MTLTKTKPLFDLTKRPRRLRTTAALRSLVADTLVRPEDFIAPYFVVPGRDEAQPVGALPGVSRFSVDRLLKELERALELGIKATVLFGVVPESSKSADAKSAHDTNGPVNRALREARSAFGDDIVLITDVCLCSYTDHGHCGLLKATPRGWVVDNDSSLEHLATMALSHAEAGADLVSPSDMMDGRVAALRHMLDAEGHSEVGILSYAVKYASAFYGPFREAAGSSPNKAANETPPDQRSARSVPPFKGGLLSDSDNRGGLPPRDRQTYQMDYRNSLEALREAALDEAEGADMLMVKPALPYLDILARLRPQTTLPLVAYNVSGEYAMLKAAVQTGALQEAPAVRESLTAIKRAGADLIVSYHAVEALEKGWLV